MTEQPRWQTLEDQVLDEGPSDPPPPELELAEVSDPVPPEDPSLPVELDDSPAELVEGTVLPPRYTQPQITVLPTWLRSPADFRSAAAWEVVHVARVTAFHSLRILPLWFRLLSRTPAGLSRLIGRWWGWANDTGTRDFMASLTHQEASQFNSLDGRRRLAQKFRFGASAIAAVLLTWACWWTVENIRVSVLWAILLLVVVPLLGYHGRPLGRTLLGSTAGAQPEPKITEPFIISALDSLGIPKLSAAIKADPINGVRFVDPVRADGPGWRADIDLPPGVTADMVISKREQLASALRRLNTAVWPGGDPDAHEARLVLWVGRQPMSKQKPTRWALEQKGTVDLFEPFPIGVDPRGRPVTITLMYALMIVGSLPRMGKSNLLRIIMCAAALDVRCEIHGFDLKSSADMLPLEPVAHRLVSGDDDEDVLALLADVRELKQTMRKRYKRIKALPRAICPQSKITPQLASRRELGLHPILLVIDECQVAFEHKDHGKELTEVIKDLGKRGPAVGIMVILATQRVDAQSIPTSISSSAVLRFCLKVMDHIANDLILGTGANSRGVKATMFSRKEVGVGYLAGEADDPTITRTALLDLPEAEQVALRARALRIAEGRLTGQAAGENFDLELDGGPTMLDHVAELWPRDERTGEPDTRAQYAALAAALLEAYPEKYPGCTQQQVSTTLRAYGVQTIDVNRDGSNRKGTTYGDIEQAIAERDDRR